MKQIEIYGVSKPQDGCKTNEDAFAIIRGEPPVVVVCDGAGDAEQSAKKVIRNFQGLVKQAGAMEYAIFQNWKSWTGMLDANLLDGHQCTFAAVAALADRIVGVNVGDGKIVKFSKGGGIAALSYGSSKKRLGNGDIDPFPIHAPMQRGEIVAVITDGAWTPLSQ